MQAKTLLIASLGLMLVGGPALADDLLMTRADVTPLTDGNVGKPFWALQAHCAGVFGAAYTYEQAHGKTQQAETDKAIGTAMLDRAVARLQMDRGLDHDTAMGAAAQLVYDGRDSTKPLLDKQGVGPDSKWNYVRSACQDIDTAAQAHLSR